MSIILPLQVQAIDVKYSDVGKAIGQMRFDAIKMKRFDDLRASSSPAFTHRADCSQIGEMIKLDMLKDVPLKLLGQSFPKGRRGIAYCGGT